MKFSNREKLLLQIIKRRRQKEFTLDQIVKELDRHIDSQPKFFRQSVAYSLRRLKDKLSIFGIDLVLVTPVGRGYKARYKIDERISTFLF